MERLLRIIANAGFVVMAPFIHSYMNLKVEPRAIRDFGAALEALRALPDVPSDRRVALFSISFGSLLALSTAGDPRYADEVGGVVVYGGYADWFETVRYCLTGRVGDTPLGTRDPLNQPVVFMNYVDWLPTPPTDRERLMAGWRAYVEEAWGQTELKSDRAFEPVARRHGDDVHPEDLDLFLTGCGVSGDAEALWLSAHERSGSHFSFLDPRPGFANMRCDLYLCHGRDDDVIPLNQVDRIADAAPDHVEVKRFITGMYGHTGTLGPLRLLGMAPALVREVGTMLGMLGALVDAPDAPR